MAEKSIFDFAPRADEPFTPSAGAVAGFSPPGDFELFLRSALFAAGPELIGEEPSFQVQRFRAQSPFAGFVSQALGATPFFVAPELLPARVIGRVPVAGRLFARGSRPERIAESPFAAAAERQVARFLPFEAARIAGTAAVNPDQTANIALQSAVDLAIVGTAGALFEGFRGARPFPNPVRSVSRRLQQSVPQLDLNAPAQVQLRSLASLRRTLASKPEQLTEDVRRDLPRYLDELRLRVRSEVPPTGGSHLKPLIGGGKQPLERLFRPNAKGKIQTRKLVQGEGGFKTLRGRKILERRMAQLPENFETIAQFPRLIRTRGEKASKDFTKTLERSIGSPVAKGAYMTREKGEGLFVLARKIKGDPKKAGPNDEFLLVKTTTPEAFEPGLRASKRTIEDAAFRTGAAANKTRIIQQVEQAEVLDDVAKFALERPDLGLDEKALLGESQLARDLSNAGASARRQFKRFFAPTLAQFSESPLAQRLMGTLRLAFRRADRRATEIMFGRPEFKSKNLITDTLVPTKVGRFEATPEALTRLDNALARLRVARPAAQSGAQREAINALEQAGGVESLVRQLDETGLAQVSQATFAGISPKQAADAGFTEQAIRLMRTLDAVDREFVRSITSLQSITDSGLKFQPLRNHMLLTRMWRGDFRQVVESETGRTVNVAGGKTRKEAEKIAQQMIEDARGVGANLRLGEAFIKGDKSFNDELTLVQTIPVSPSNDPLFRAFRATQEGQAERLRAGFDPAFTQTRKDIGGAIGSQKPFTGDELSDILKRAIFDRERFVTNLAVESSPRLQAAQQRLATEDPFLARQIGERLRDLQGLKRPLPKAIEAPIDAALAPFLGANGASRIVRTLNSAMFNLQLGMGDLGFPILNAGTYLQTVLPEIAFNMTATPARLSRYYSFAPVTNSQKQVVGQVGTLDPLKLTNAAWRAMTKPDADLAKDFEWAAREGIWAPKFVEEFAGQAAERATGIAAAFKEGKFVEGLKAVSQLLPAQSEQLARGHAFVTGRIIAKDFHGIKNPDQIRRFAEEFTYRTMFLYSAADRPAVMSGAIGSMLGLFKNWTAHYISNFSLYGGQALRGNFNPLMWSMAGTWSIAGLGGLPFIGAADAMSRIMTDRSLVTNMFDWWGYQADVEKTFGEDAPLAMMDGLWYGLPAFLGVSLQSRGAAPGSDMARDASMMFSFALLDRINATGAALGESVEAFRATGRHPINSERIRNLWMRALGPKTLYRAMGSVENDSLKSLRTGNTLARDLTALEKYSFIFGTTPTRVERIYEASGQLWRSQQKMRRAVTSMGREYAAAMAEGDSRRMGEIVARAAVQGNLDSVMRSANNFMYKDRTEQIDRQFETLQSISMQRALGLR